MAVLWSVWCKSLYKSVVNLEHVTVLGFNPGEDLYELYWCVDFSDVLNLESFVLHNIIIITSKSTIISSHCWKWRPIKWILWHCLKPIILKQGIYCPIFLWLQTLPGVFSKAHEHLVYCSKSTCNVILFEKHLNVKWGAHLSNKKERIWKLKQWYNFTDQHGNWCFLLCKLQKAVGEKLVRIRPWLPRKTGKTKNWRYMYIVMKYYVFRSEKSCSCKCNEADWGGGGRARRAHPPYFGRLRYSLLKSIFPANYTTLNFGTRYQENPYNWHWFSFFVHLRP